MVLGGYLEWRRDLNQNGNPAKVEEDMPEFLGNLHGI